MCWKDACNNRLIERAILPLQGVLVFQAATGTCYLNKQRGHRLKRVNGRINQIAKPFLWPTNLQRQRFTYSAYQIQGDDFQAADTWDNGEALGFLT